MGLVTRHLERLVLDPELDAELREVGFTLAVPLLDEAEVEALRRLHSQLVRLVGEPEGPWFTTGMIAERDTRRWIFDAVGEIVLPRLTELLGPSAKAMSGNLHVNPVHDGGGLGPHQDIAIVDETVSSTLNAWVGLSDTSEENGALRFVPCSHRFGNVDRSLATPWAFEGLHEVFWANSVRVEAQAGQVILFDTATIHCSTPNRSGEPRAAANALVRHRDQPLQHLVARGDDDVDVYRIDEAFLVEDDVTSAPSAGRGHVIATRRRVRPPADRSPIERLCQEGMALLEDRRVGT